MLNINKVICDILQINEEEFTDLVAKGQRPVKAAIRLGADVKKAQLVATLQVAVSAEDIDAVYSDTSVKSCMTGSNVGEFYEAHSVACIHSPNFRTLVNVLNNTLVGSSYGYHGHKVQELLQPYFRVGFDFLPLTDITVKRDTISVVRDEEYQTVTTYSLMYIRGLNTKMTNADTALLYKSNDLLTLESGQHCMVLRTGTLVEFTLIKETFEDWFFDQDEEDGVTHQGSKITVRETLTRSVVQSVEVVKSYMEFESNEFDGYIPYIDNDFSSYYVEI